MLYPSRTVADDRSPNEDESRLNVFSLANAVAAATSAALFVLEPTRYIIVYQWRRKDDQLHVVPDETSSSFCFQRVYIMSRARGRRVCVVNLNVFIFLFF